MPHKVVLIPILSPAFDSDFVIQIALRSVAAFGNEARAEKWNAALEYSILVPGDQADPKFENFESSTAIRSAFEKCSSKINSKPESLATSLKSSIFNACRLRWDQCDILSPVKSKTGLNSKRTNHNSRNEGHKWTNSIVLIGEFGPGFTTENAKSILSAQTLKIIRKHQINLIHVCEKSTPIFPSSVTTLKSDDYPTQRLYDPFQIEMLFLTEATSNSEPLFPETSNEAQLYINETDSISVSITGEITSIRPLANLGPASVALLVPHFNFQFTATGYVSKSQKLPRHLIGQHILVNLNNDDCVKCIFFLYKSTTKYIFYLKPLHVIGSRLQTGSPRRVLENQRRRNVGGVLHPHFTLHDTSIDPKIQKLIVASKQKMGGGFLRGRIDQLGRLNRKNDFNSFNIMPTKLRVRATPTKTPLKTELTPSRRGGSQTPSKSTGDTPVQTKELKLLSRQVPKNLEELLDSANAALKHKSFPTVVRVTLNFMMKHEGVTLQEIRKCKNDVIEEFGGSDALEVEIKKQIIFHLSESDEEDETNFKHLTELMRWLTFSSSSLKMIQFFNEDVIPILIEYDHQLSIERLIKAYQDLFIAIPKTLTAYAPDEDSSSDDNSDGQNDQEDIVSLGRSSSITASVSSIYSNIFLGSNASSSNMDYGNMRRSETARFRPISNARQLEVRRISEPGGNSRAAYSRSQSTSALSSTLIATDDGRKGKNRKNGKETEKVRRSLFSSPTFGSPNKNFPSTSGIAQKARKLKTKVVEDTPSKKQQFTRSERMKETMKRRRSRIDSNRNGNGISVVAESPERKTRYYSGIPDLSVTTSDSFNESSLFKRALSADTSMVSADLSKSTLDLFSPPKSKQHAQTLLFGPSSEEQSSEDEIGTKNSILSSPPYTSNSHSTESTLQTSAKDALSATAPKLTSKDVKKTPQSIRNSRRNLFRSSEKSKDVFNDSLEALQKAPILTPSPHGPKNRQSRLVNRARRQLRLSESEK